LRAIRRLAADAAAWAITGTAASLKAARLMAAEAGTWIVTGTAANLTRAYRIAAGAASWTIAAGDAGLRALRRLVAEAAAWIVSGTDAVLTYLPSYTFQPGNLRAWLSDAIGLAWLSDAIALIWPSAAAPVTFQPAEPEQTFASDPVALSYPSEAVTLKWEVDLTTTLQKQPSESWPYDFDFTARLAQVGTDVDSVTSITQTLKATGASTTDLVISAPAIVGKVVQVRISGGVGGVTYKLTCRIEDTGGNDVEMEGFLKVKDT
jgi:hypothetical protein